MTVGVEELPLTEKVRRPPSDTAKVKRSLKGDLDNIVLKALRKEPDRRYASVEQFAEDINRHLRGLPVAATPDSIPYRVNKFVQRHRIGMAASALILLALIGGITIALREARIAQAERAKAERRLNDVRQLSDSLIFEINDAIQNLPGATPVRKLLLDRTVQYMDSVSKDAAGYPDLERELANGYRRLAAVQGDPTQSNLGDAKAAENNVRKALALFEDVARSNPGNIADQLNVAAMHRVLSYSSLMEPGGRRELEQSMVIGERLMKIDGKDPWVRSERSVQYQNLGLMQDGLGDRLRAAESLRKDLEIKYDILRDNPEFARIRLHIGVASVLLAAELTKIGSRREALETIESGLHFFSLMHTEASDLDLDPREALAQMKRGDIQLMDGNIFGARQSFHEARMLLEPMAKSDPQNYMLQLDLAGVDYEEGRLLAVTGSENEAVSLLERARHIFESLHAPDRGMDETPHGLAAIYIWLAEAEAKSGDAGHALETYLKAVDALRVQPGETMHDDSRCELITALAKIGTTRMRMGNLEEAEASFRQALDVLRPSETVGPDDMPILYALADLYSELGDVMSAKAQRTGDATRRLSFSHEARNWYQKSLIAWNQIPNPSRLSPTGFSVGDPHRIPRRLAKFPQ